MGEEEAVQREVTEMSNTIVTLWHFSDNNVVIPVHIVFVPVLLYSPSRA